MVELLHISRELPAVNPRWWPEISAHRSADGATPRPHWAGEAPAQTMTAWGNACCTAAGTPPPGLLEQPEKGGGQSGLWHWFPLDQFYTGWIMYLVCTAPLWLLLHVVFLRGDVNLSAVIFSTESGSRSEYMKLNESGRLRSNLYFLKKHFKCIMSQKGVGFCLSDRSFYETTFTERKPVNSENFPSIVFANYE